MEKAEFNKWQHIFDDQNLWGDNLKYYKNETKSQENQRRLRTEKLSRPTKDYTNYTRIVTAPKRNGIRLEYRHSG